jgi:hypothetical protein
MATNTYVALKSSTVTGSNAATVLLDNIPQGYTDLVLVIQGRFDTSGQTIREFRLRFNGDTGTNYSSTRMIGDGSSASSDRLSNFSNMRFGVFPAANSTSGILGTAICHIQNYSSTSVYKTVLNRTSDPQGWVTEAVGLWRNSAAITSVEVAISETQTGNWLVGSTFTIYGIAAEGALAKATGGAIYSDSQYWYHAFGASGTFTPTQSLTADILVVAGGGGGGGASSGGGQAGGGGAGGLLAFSSQALSATGYTVTVGAGGAYGASNAQGSLGADSQFGALTLVKGGGGGGSYGASGGSMEDGAAGGSGGGVGQYHGTGTRTGGAGTSGQGNAGGGPDGAITNYAGGGGGGAGAAGTKAIAGYYAGAGGAGLTSSLIQAMGTATGAGESVAGTYYFAGGGGGCGNPVLPDGGYGAAGGVGGGGAAAYYQTTSAVPARNGLASSGGGGGGGSYTPNGTIAGNGGSGIVIVRYAK